MTVSNSSTSQLNSMVQEVSTEDANHKFLRSLPSAWSNLAMTMRTNPEIDNLSIEIFTCTPSTSSTNAPEKEVHAVFADEVIYSLFAKQTEDLDFYKKQEGEFERLGWKNTVGFNKKKLDCFIVTIMSTLLGNVQQRCTRWKEEEDSPYQHQEAGKQREES
ncbi:hypothetical protein Tco_1449828 [Tanacetum coccineum]